MPHTNAPHELLTRVLETDNGLKARMREIKTHFTNKSEYSILDAFGSDYFVRVSGWRMAEHLFNDSKKYQESIDAVRDLNKLYLEGVGKLSKIRESLPRGINDAYDRCNKQNNNKNAKESSYSKLEKTVDSHGYNPNHVYELTNTLEYYKMDEENTRRLIDVLEKAREIHKKEIGTNTTQAQREKFKQLLKGAVHATFYDKANLERHLEKMTNFRRP